MRRLAKFTIRRQQSQEVSRQNLIFPENCDIIIIQSKEKITYKAQESRGRLNRLELSTYNRRVGGSIPPRGTRDTARMAIVPTRRS